MFLPFKTVNLPIEIVHAQAAAIILQNRSSIAINVLACFATINYMLIAYGVSVKLLIWMLIISLSVLARHFFIHRADKTGFASVNPRETINILSIFSLLQGAGWAFLPIYFDRLNLMGNDAAIILIYAAMASSAAVRINSYATIPILFAFPICLSLGWAFLREGGVVSIMMTIELGLLFVCYAYFIRLGERNFIRNEFLRQQNESSSTSLTIANEDIRQKNLRLEALANGDPVTGLFNRIYFNGKMAGDLAAAHVNQESLALILLDIDRFTPINDAFGHRGGDMLLATLARRLKAAAGVNAIVARVNGDEFAVLLTGDDITDLAISTAYTMIAMADEPVSVFGKPVHISLSAGLAFFPDHADDADSLFSMAGIALTAAKQGGKRQFRQFDPAMKASIDRQRIIESDFSDAIKTGELEPWFQPQIDLETRAIVGFEALARWDHPVLGRISPPEIVEAAHAMHLSEQFTTAITEAACRLLVILPSYGAANATVSINISPREFTLYNVPDMLDRITEKYGVNRTRLEIEITEEAILDPEMADEQLQRMEQAGYMLAVDDFGMGHSSLAYLISLKVDRLKIDQSFVRDVDTIDTQKAMITALVGLGNALNVNLVVEGVETEAEQQTLKAMGCHIGQGYLFARPMPLPMLKDWLKHHTPQQARTPLAVRS